MSAVLAGASAVFEYKGASVTLSCSSPTELKNALATFGIGTAANDSLAPPPPDGYTPPTRPDTPKPQGNASPSPAPTAQATAGSSPAPAAASGASAGSAGNASASTGTQASAPAAASGSAAAGDASAPTYQDVSARITTLCKKPGGRDKCLKLLATFTGQNGQPADHGNKLKVEDYPVFIQKIDAEIGSAA